MDFEIFIYILRWVTKRIRKMCDLPAAHPKQLLYDQSLTSPWQFTPDFISFVLGERCLDMETNLLQLSRLNPRAEWVIKIKS
jgi:hypothetical protein